MPESPLIGVRYPTQDDGPYGAEQLAAAVADLEPYVVGRYVNAADRDAKVYAFQLAGGTVEDGLLAYTIEDRRHWRRDSTDPSGWSYAGGAPPPTVLIPPLAGWTTPAGHKAYAYKDASGLVHLGGWLTSTAAYTPSAAQYGGQLPVGYRPIGDSQVFDIPMTNGRATVTILTDGRIRTDVLVAPATATTANANWWLYGVHFHPTASVDGTA